MPYLTRLPAAAALLIAAVPMATVTTVASSTPSAQAPTPSVYAVTVGVRSAHRTLTAQGFADTTRQTADLTTRLPDGHNAELRLIAGKAYVHLGPGAPWLSINPAALGIPVRALWAAAATGRLTMEIGPEHTTTLTVHITAAAMDPRPVQAHPEPSTSPATPANSGSSPADPARPPATAYPPRPQLVVV
jgi:hypothetical protein